MSELRRLLGEKPGEKPGEHKFIVTKPGQGYRFVASVSLEFVADASSGMGRRDSEPVVEGGPRPVPAARRRWRSVASRLKRVFGIEINRAPDDAPPFA